MSSAQIKKSATSVLTVAAGVMVAGLIFRYLGNQPVISDARQGLVSPTTFSV